MEDGRRDLLTRRWDLNRVIISRRPGNESRRPRRTTCNGGGFLRARGDAVSRLCKLSAECSLSGSFVKLTWNQRVRVSSMRVCVWHTRATTCRNARFARNARVSRESANDKQLVPTISTGSAGDIRDASIVPRIITRLFAVRSIHLRA